MKSRAVPQRPEVHDAPSEPSKKRPFDAVDQGDAINGQPDESEIEVMGRVMRAFQPAPKRSKLLNSNEEDSFVEAAPSDFVPKQARVQGRQAWTDEETKLFVQAFEQFGYGKWKEMREWCRAKNASFESRTSTDLRDKYRNLAKQAKQLSLVQDAFN